MPKICREEDSLTTGHECTTTSTLDTPSQTTVFVEGKLVARAGWEMPDAEYKALKFVEAKAKQPKENKSK